MFADSAWFARLRGVSGLAESASWTRDELAEFQSRQLRALVQRAYSSVPYYRRLFDRVGLKPRDVRGLEDLQRVPVTTRADLQRLPVEEMVARGVDPSRLVMHRTSGSSGEPLTIRRTRFEDRLLQAYRLKVNFSLGLRVTDRRVAVVTVRDAAAQPPYMRLGLLARDEIHCLLPPENILARLRELQPEWLSGYAGSLSWLAGFLTEADRRRIRPRLVTTDSETLTSDMRVRIGEGFGAPVIDFYDSHEFNLIAWECRRAGVYHASDTSVIAEVLRDGRPAAPGDEGELVGTALHSWAMPFIRFRLGDIVTRGPHRCPCGGPNSVIGKVIGRTADRFHLPDGRSIHPYALVRPLLTRAPWLRRYQIIQEQPDFIRVKLLPLASLTATPESVGAVRQALVEGLGGGVHVAADVVEEIPPGVNGKFRPYYSLVSGSLAS